MNKFMLTAIAATLVLSGCATTPPTNVEIAKDQLQAESIKNAHAQSKAEDVINAIPSWVLNPPKNDSTGVYAIGIGESRKLDTAMKKSSLNAQFELAKSFGQEMSGNEQSYTKDEGYKVSEQYKQLIDGIVDSVPMTGYQTIEHEVKTMDGKFLSYRLMKLSYEQINNTLKQQYDSKITNEEMKEAFTELERRLDKRKATNVETEQPETNNTQAVQTEHVTPVAKAKVENNTPTIRRYLAS